MTRTFVAALALALASSSACASRAHVTSAPLDAPPAARAAQPTFRVMSFNIRHGEGADGQIDLGRVAAVITAEDADLVALQEVDKGTTRSGGRDLAAELAALTGMTAVFSNNFPYQGGEYGNALLTRFPVKRWTNTHLRMLREGEQRGVLQVVVDANGRDLLLLATHIDYRPDDSERLQNVAQFREILEQYVGIPTVFAGDFNDVPGSRTYLAMAESFDDVWVAAGEGEGLTYPSRGPAKRIDYLWVGKGSPLKPLRAWAPQADASDHLPLLCEFEWEGRD